MAFKERIEPIVLTKLRILKKRMKLTEEENRYFHSLDKGYKGEVQFDLLTEKLTTSCLILNELLFEVEKTTFQIDTLIIFAETMYVFEIKHNSGDYIYKADGLTSITKDTVIKNPLDQLNRSKILFKKLLSKIGYNLPFKAYVVFNNPEFTLYQTPPDLPFIFPTQLKRLFNELNSQQGKINTGHKKLASKLVELHQTDSSFNKSPQFDYNQLKKGITCNECDSFSVTVTHKYLDCNACGSKEVVETAVMRNVREFIILFPERKVTTQAIYEWCVVIKNSKRIRRILVKHLEIEGSRKWTSYK
ncbi:NERD domain-containing protein [Mesobacillus subterraneus]|uniref:nuclease-related domain-containing protein n=1 Tax=Mesobacillus subterraneus TaxID=285983 RepID=UPI00203B2364|nr:nuclease-related domain-containing protein [Mesobacillus subterraneus]MCM3666115.1 NERD domain-containing protein [Mesobacillus subterraneus]MCM3685113.1 NERD domain-containing protein [Mesobacillus subterraneus]